MRLLHNTIGILIVILFLLTGQYMELYYPRMEEVDDGVRMLLRSRHIYLLLAGLVNLGIGSYFSIHHTRRRKVLQLTGSALVLLSPFLLLAAFFYEPTAPAKLSRAFTLPGIVALLTGTLLHLISGARQGKSAAVKANS